MKIKKGTMNKGQKKQICETSNIWIIIQEYKLEGKNETMIKEQKIWKITIIDFSDYQTEILEVE